MAREPGGSGWLSGRAGCCERRPAEAVCTFRVFQVVLGLGQFALHLLNLVLALMGGVRFGRVSLGVRVWPRESGRASLGA